MINRWYVKAALGLLTCGALAFAQQIPVAKQPQPKSKKEVEALQAMFNATDPDGRIKAAQNLITQFADTEFKAVALYFAAESYRQKNDAENAIVYAEKTLEADPKNYGAMLLIATTTAQRTRENDLDKEEKLNLSEKYAKQVMDIVKDAPRPNPQITDDQWNNARKDVTAQAHEALGMVAMVRKKNDVAIQEFKTAVDGASQPEPRTMLFLGQLYNQSGKYDDAVAVLDKCLAQPDLHPQIKQLAESQKNYATRMKAATQKPAAPAAAPAPPAPAAPPKPAEPETKKP